jgi:hypothetical protein
MLKQLLLASAVLGTLLFCGGQTAGTQAAQNDRESPVDNWAGRWPQSQLTEESSIEPQALGKLPRGYDYVSYPSLSASCGTAFVSLGPLETGGLKLSLSWIPSRTPEGKVEELPGPKKGEVKAAILAEGEVVAEPTNGEPAIIGWIGDGRGSQGAMMIEFEWLPADFEDYWIRLDLKEERFWLLVPYGLGSNPAENGAIKQLARGGPTSPKGAGVKDLVLNWSAVHYKVFRETENNNLSVSLVVTNEEYSQVHVELYRENERWTLDTPRTSATYLWPNGYTRYGWLYELTRDTSYRRWDSFQFFHHGHETRSWGLLRVSVEEKATDLCVPSSLFHARHGQFAK